MNTHISYDSYDRKRSRINENNNTKEKQARKQAIRSTILVHSTMKGEYGNCTQVAPNRAGFPRDGKAEERHEHEVIWGSNPNHHYFAYFIENRRNLTGKVDDGSTLEEILAGPRKALARYHNSSSLASEPIAGSVQSTVPSETSVSSEAQTDVDPELAPVSSPRMSTPPPKTPPVRSPPIPGDANGSGSHQPEVPPFIYVGDSPLTVRVQSEDSEPDALVSNKTRDTWVPGRYSQHTVMILLVILVFCLMGIAVGVVVFLRAQEQE